ncbi:MAG: hypothetical protein WD894_03700, partial [Pirellulales bacterium]
KEYYDRLVSKVRSLEMEISEGRISGEHASRAVNLLRTELAEVRKEIEEQKTFVPVAKMHLKSDATTFEPGPERRLLIMASKVRIVGWDKPEVKCVLDKTVLTAGDEPVEEHIEQMRVIYESRSAENEIGKTAEALEAEEEAFLTSPEGKNLDEKARAWRRRLLEERKKWQGIYRPVQGRTIDVVSVNGLSHKEGNRQITLEVSSKNGEGSMSSHWQRHATLTVYVPACEAIVVQGGLGGLDIESVESALIVRGDGDRDYHGQFRVKGLKGPLTVDRLPLQTIDGVSGDANVTMTTYLGNSGTRHANDTRTSYVYPPEQYTYKNIEGDFRGWFVRADLELANIGGSIDVVNEYGETKLTVENPLPSAAHRLITHGGQITLQLDDKALGDLPLLAVSECGTVRLGFDDRSFEDVSWTSNMFHDELRGWRGFERKAPNAERDSFFERFERVSQVLSGEDRTPGLDLVARGGLIEINRTK